MTKDKKSDDIDEQPAAEIAERAPLGDGAASETPDDDERWRPSTDNTTDMDEPDRTRGENDTDDASRQDDTADQQLTEQVEEETPAENVDDKVEAPAPVKAKGRGLAVLALLFAMLGVGGVGYLYYLLVYSNPLGELQNEKDALAAKYESLEQKLEQDLSAVRRSTDQALQQADAAAAARLAENEKAMIKSLQDALDTAPPSEREWKLAEAQYMLRIANHRVLMEQDATGALSLLEATDQILAEIDDFALHQVRARLADEIVSLKQVRRDDVQGIYLQLEAIKSQVASLPFLTPEYLQEVAAPDADKSVWETLYDEFTKFVRIRTLAGDESIKPLLAPAEERYVELNLRLAIEQAQLATLRRQQGVYEHSLQSINNWLTDYMDADDPSVASLIEQTRELLNVDLERPLPDVSGSLNELREALRSGS